MISLESDDQSAIYLGDICPTTAHLKVFWTMAYDQFPLEVRQQKAMLFEDIVARSRLILFDHDPTIYGAFVERDDRGNLQVTKSLS